MNPNVKGRELESAVHAIEAVILASAPGLREECFTIEARKRINVGGVHHEIDILVKTEMARGYGSTFIFECKNWEESVGKNEIIVFSEKIAALGANRGYFVAKSFTRDAEAQAVKDQRITLLNATEHDPAFWTADLPEGVHPMRATARRSFNGGECFIGGREMEDVAMELEFGVRIIRPQVVSEYEVSSRGRVMRFADVDIQEFLVSPVFVQPFDASLNSSAEGVFRASVARIAQTHETD